MTAKVIMVLVVFNVLETEAASASGTHSEANGCIVIPASGGSEQIQSCSDSTSLLQAQVRAHSEEGGQMSEDSSSWDDAEETRRRGRRRRYGPTCRLPREDMACELHSIKNGKTTFQKPDSCFPGCENGKVVVGSPSRKYLECNGGVLSSTPPDYTCMDDLSAPGKLTVTVVKASGLADEDWMAGESDPYVVVRLNGKVCDSCQTPTVENSNDPQWNYDISFDISSMNDQLSFRVWDEDSAAVDDKLGWVNDNGKLRLLIQKGGGEETYDYQLSSSSGTLTVKLNFQA